MTQRSRAGKGLFAVLVGVLIALPVLTMDRPAQAAVVSLSLDAPFAGGDVIDCDLGATVTDVTGVTIEMDGFAGEQRWICYVTDNPTGSLPLDAILEFDRDVDSGASAASTKFYLPVLTEFTASREVTPTEGWGFLADGHFTLTVRYVHEPYFAATPPCYGIGYTLPVIDHLVVTVTCASAVPTEVTAWGAVKGLYR